EGLRHLASALNKRLIDLTRACVKRIVKLLRAGIESFSTSFKLCDKVLSTFSKCALHFRQAVIEFAGHQQRHAALKCFVECLGALVECLGQCFRGSVCPVIECRNTRFKKTGERLARRHDTLREFLGLIIDCGLDRHAAALEATYQSITGF
ncbi:unnamed protein product, partial [Laminaria digitata]